jgi:hypothetical protein
MELQASAKKSVIPAGKPESRAMDGNFPSALPFE